MVYMNQFVYMNQSELKLNPKQKRFCEEYIIDLNATQAAIRCGYSEKTADVQASRLLADVRIQRRIAALIAERTKNTDISAEKVLQGIASIAFSTEARHNDRLKGFELLGKYLALFIDRSKVEMDGKLDIDGNIEVFETFLLLKEKAEKELDDTKPGPNNRIKGII